MKLEVGKHYLSAGGEVIKINYTGFAIINHENTFVFYDTCDNYYEQDGKCIGDIREFDLIAEIPKELHQHLIQTIKAYHTDSDFKATVDNVYGVKQ